jgi:hypothetical protein
MSFWTPTQRKTGPVTPLLIASLRFRDPTPTKRDFQIRLDVNTVKISVNVLKQSRAKNVTSRKNW